MNICLQVTVIPTFESVSMQEWYQQTLDRQRELGITVLGSNSTVAMQDETFPACKIEFWGVLWEAGVWGEYELKGGESVCEREIKCLSRQSAEIESEDQAFGLTEWVVTWDVPFIPRWFTFSLLASFAPESPSFSTSEEETHSCGDCMIYFTYDPVQDRRGDHTEACLQICRSTWKWMSLVIIHGIKGTLCILVSSLCSALCF